MQRGGVGREGVGRGGSKINYRIAVARGKAPGPYAVGISRPLESLFIAIDFPQSDR